MENELISVIVPIYNIEKHLEKCLDSIINQTYKNLEIILIDDGSTDNCGNICDKYKRIDKRIIVVHKINGGLSSARNKGLDIAKGNLISFVDGDDYIENNMIEELKNNMDKYNSDISVCNYYNYKKNKRSIINKEFVKDDFVSIEKEKFNNILNEYKSITSQAWNKLYKRYIFDDIRYPEGKVYEDSFVICDILDKANKVSYTSKPLYNYVYRSNSIVNTIDDNQFNKIEAFNKIIMFFDGKGYYDLEIKEKNLKMNKMIMFLSKMRQYKIKNKNLEKKYYKELLKINKEIKWREATKNNRFFKTFRKSSIRIITYAFRIKNHINN